MKKRKRRKFVLKFSLDLEGYEDVCRDLILEDMINGDLITFCDDFKIKEMR